MLAGLHRAHRFEHTTLPREAGARISHSHKVPGRSEWVLCAESVYPRHQFDASSSKHQHDRTIHAPYAWQHTAVVSHGVTFWKAAVPSRACFAYSCIPLCAPLWLPAGRNNLAHASPVCRVRGTPADHTHRRARLPPCRRGRRLKTRMATCSTSTRKRVSPDGRSLVGLLCKILTATSSSTTRQLGKPRGRNPMTLAMLVPVKLTALM